MYCVCARSECEKLHLFSMSFETVDPVIANAIAELLLLTIEHRIWEIGIVWYIKSLPQYVLLQARMSAIRPFNDVDLRNSMKVSISTSLHKA